MDFVMDFHARAQQIATTHEVLVHLFSKDPISFGDSRGIMNCPKTLIKSFVTEFQNDVYPMQKL